MVCYRESIWNPRVLIQERVPGVESMEWILADQLCYLHSVCGMAEENLVLA